MPAKIHIERMMHRASIAVQGESAASYALLKLIPTGEGGGVGLNLALMFCFQAFESILWALQRFDILNAVLIPAKLEAGMVYTTSIAAQRDFGFNGFLAKMVLRY